jgi:hypothetical protein
LPRQIALALTQHVVERLGGRGRLVEDGRAERGHRRRRARASLQPIAGADAGVFLPPLGRQGHVEILRLLGSGPGNPETGGLRGVRTVYRPAGRLVRHRGAVQRGRRAGVAAAAGGEHEGADHQGPAGECASHVGRLRAGGRSGRMSSKIRNHNGF